MRIFSVFGKSNNVYFPGCMTYFKHKKHFELYKEIFSRLDIDFKILDKKICCGLPVLESGYENEARKLARRNFEIFKEENIKTIITNSPCCYKMLLQNYPELIPDWNIEIRNIWQLILDRLEEKPKLIKNKVISTVLYQDSCYLGRYCGIYNPRQILEMIGYQIKEFSDNRENSTCCGSCGNLPIINPELADKIAKDKILQAKRAGINKIIVSSIEDYDLLKNNAGGSKIEIIELSEAIAEALGIRTKDIDEYQENISEELEDIKK